ncbi:MAG: alpha/beta hydrolase [bacterium]
MIKKKKTKKILLISLIVTLVLILGILIAIPPLIMGDMVNGHVDFKEIYRAEDFGLSADRITLTTSDQYEIIAHEVDVKEPKAVIIFLSGIHNPSVTAFFGHSKMFMEEGYASILVEMRAHGESQGDTIALGYKEYLDVQAAVNYIKGTPEYAGVPIVAYGLSMGASTAINSIGNISEIDGLVSLSAYSSWEDVFSDNMVKMGAPAFYASIQKPFVKLYSLVKYGLSSYNNTPENNISKLGNRPALLIHSTGDSQIPYINFERLAAAAPPHVETWTREGDLHFIIEDTKFLHPQRDVEYARRLIGFMNGNFGE